MVHDYKLPFFQWMLAWLKQDYQVLITAMPYYITDVNLKSLEGELHLLFTDSE